MKQIDENKLCFYCFGCEKLALQDFKGVMNCKDFMKARETSKYYQKLNKGMKNN